MKRNIALLLCVMMFLFCAGCGQEVSVPSAEVQTVSVTDANNCTVSLAVEEPLRVVCLYSSYAQMWLSAGGTLCGVVEDAVIERELEVADAEIVGTVKEPNVEEILALQPDWVILSADLTAHAEAQQLLEAAGLSCSAFRVDTFDDYTALMEQMVQLTGETDRLAETVQPAAEKIEQTLAMVSTEKTTPDVLLIRAFSSGMKAKTEEELAGAILNDLGAHNIASDFPSMLEELSLEQVILSDPEYIFITTMGDEEQALAYLNEQIDKSPVWQTLTAVQNGRVIVLPKDLFHYKPNALWGDSYEYLAKILYQHLYE